MERGEYTARRGKRILFTGLYDTGKTTLINALLGAEIAPMEDHNWVPRTETPTCIQYGQRQQAIVHFPETLSTKTTSSIPQQAYLHMQHHSFQNCPPMEVSWEEREKYTVSVSRPEERSHKLLPFTRLELTAPCELLRSGLEFVDTRGFVSYDVNNEALIRELTTADTAVFVLDARLLMQPECAVLDEEEEQFLQRYLVPALEGDILFAVNCIDEIPSQVQSRFRENAWCVLQPFTRYGKDGIFFLSARNALNGKLNGNQDKIEHSGILSLENMLKDLAGNTSDTETGSRTSTADYFSWDNIRELSDLDGHIAFASQLINKHDWNMNTKWELTSQLREIRNKQQDKKLNLSVIGEFSSGKSTFINALLRMDLLEACVLQGTTVASTILEYGKDYQIEIKHKNGRAERLRFLDFDQLKQKLNTIVAENDNAQDLASVTVQLPSETLKAGQFRIIDTPGLDATVQWHSEVTVQALRKKSDISIILVDAVRPLPDSLCEFISEHLEQVLDQCVFVVTKIDLIPPKERKMMLNYVERVAKTRLGVKKPLVLSYASLEVMNTFAPDSFPKSKYQEDTKVSFESEAKIMAHMAQKRAMVQAQKLLSLVDRIYDGISQQMRTMTEDYQKRLEMLERSRQADLTEFVQMQKSVRETSFDKKTLRVHSLVSWHSKELSGTMQQRIMKTIDEQITTDKLNAYLKNDLAEDCRKLGVALCEDLIRDANMTAIVNTAFREEMSAFQDAFKQQFQKLKCLVPKYDFTPAPLPKIAMPEAQFFSSAMDNAQKTVNRENRRIGGAAAAGAVAGSAVFPVIGTLVGAGIGFFAGCFFGADLNKMKANAKQELSDPLQRYFDQIAEQGEKKVAKYIRKMSYQIGGEIDRYLQKYQEEVDGWIREEKKKRAELEHKVQMIREDMHQIEIRRNNLESVRNRMKRSKEA